VYPEDLDRSHNVYESLAVRKIPERLGVLIRATLLFEDLDLTGVELWLSTRA
jgi:hypothetical protein